MDPAGVEFRNTKDLMKVWAKEMSMPPALRDELLNYIAECRDLLRQRYYGSLNGLLSPALHGQVSEHLHGGWLHALPLFQCDDEKESKRFTRAIAKARAHRPPSLTLTLADEAANGPHFSPAHTRKSCSCCACSRRPR